MAEQALGRFAGLAPAGGTAETSETTGRAPARRFALEKGLLASHGPMAWRGSMACHFPEVSEVPVRPPENEIPRGRPANSQRHSSRTAQPLAKPMLRTSQGAEPRASLRSALLGAQASTCHWGAHGARPARLLRAQPMAKRLLCHLRRSRGAAAPAKGTPLAWPLARAQQFCSARPVRAPKARHRLING